jgi:hypothetical protein
MRTFLMSDLMSRPYRPAACCEACAFGGEIHTCVPAAKPLNFEGPPLEPGDAWRATLADGRVFRGIVPPQIS